MAQNEYYLMHHGVKGMRWGVRRTPAQLGHRTVGEKAKTKLNDPEFKRKAAKAAKIALVVGAAYATHKLSNNPQAVKAGKEVLAKVLKNSGSIKASVANSAEFKAAMAVGKVGKKALKFVGSENFRATVSGIGAMAGTAAVLRSQIKGLKDKVDGDAIDKALAYTKKGSEIGQSVSNLAKGPRGAVAPNQTSSSSSNSSSGGKEHTATLPGGVVVKTTRHMGSEEWGNVRRYIQAHPGMNKKEAMDELGYLHPDEVRHSGSKSTQRSSSSGQGLLMKDSSTGKTVRTNRPVTIKDTKQIGDYRKIHPNKSLEEALDDLGLLDKDYIHHYAFSTGWRFNTSYKNRYIF